LPNGKHFCKMVFNGGIAGYEGTAVRDASTKGSSSWNEGDVIYIAFHKGDAIVPGTAVYSASDGWSVSYDGDLAEGSSQQCEVRFFVNTTFANENLVTLNPNTEIYEDAAGTFNYSNGTVSVSASLTPKVGRIRFTGNAGDRIYVTGISTYTTYSPAGNAFSTTAAMVPLDVDATGSTPYVYGFFTYEDRKLGLVGSDFAFTRNCGATVFQTGDSGYMKIPSKTSHNNWKTGLTITVNGVDFRMLPVAGFSGGFFLLGETEVTDGLFYSVYDDSSYLSQKPHIHTYEVWTGFITQLNYKTNLHFYIPSMDEWQFAAKGGLLSQGYIYSGSNTPGDVAWYAGNAGGSSHDVKGLTPNELGLYDMSGNAAELTSTVDTNYSTSYHFLCGGWFDSPESYIKNTSSFSSYDRNNSGLRVALKCE
ncbi:MAG: SUMF1/EgtB/PvdO family nonheme iron enzyme, partial [Bacteroidales bacterium]|nr:SUMF1/EgtB/PvdO family nonheme iron enzyme [Bacteroidales bacterium]